MFLIPLDRRREWYRYHALFREFLLGELRRVEPEVVMKLHLRAADWYEAQRVSGDGPGAPAEHDRAGAVRPAGDGAGPADLPGRPDVDRATLAVGARRLRDRGLSPAGRAGRLGRGVHRADRRGATLGGDRRRRVVRPGAGRRHGVVRLGAGDAAGRHVCRRSRADDDRRRASPSRRSRRGARGGTPRSASAPRRICSPGTSTRPRAVRRVVRRWPPRSATPTRSSSASPSSPCWRWIAGGGRRRPGTSSGRSPPSRSIGCTTTPPACSRSPPRPGSPCTAAT